MNDLKQELFEACTLFANNKLQNIERTMQANQLALENESKSSAGDKHETGRAMLHLEMEKASQQLAVVGKMKEVLQRIDLNASSHRARLGSLVKTSQGHYFLSISAGPIEFKGNTYYAISASSPIGALLLGKSEGDQISLAGKTIDLISIA